MALRSQGDARRQTQHSSTVPTTVAAAAASASDQSDLSIFLRASFLDTSNLYRVDNAEGRQLPPVWTGLRSKSPASNARCPLHWKN